jgi:hypothetical protein
MVTHANTQLSNSLHYHHDSYWCPGCWAFVLDCSHLVDTLETKRVPLNDPQLRAAWFDRDRSILQVEMSTGELFQYCKVPLRLALELVRSPRPAEFMREHITAKAFRWVRARGRRQYKRMLMELAEAAEGLVD